MPPAVLRRAFCQFFANLDFGAGAFNGSGRFTITREVVATGGTTSSRSARFQLGSTVA